MPSSSRIRGRRLEGLRQDGPRGKASVMIGSMGKAKAETPETKPVERTKQLDDVADHERQEDNGKLDSTIDKGA